MAERMTISVRFDGKGEDRISSKEWAEMQHLVAYFKLSSVSQLVESAMHYAYARNALPELQIETESCLPLLPVLRAKFALFEDSLNNGNLIKDLHIKGKNISVMLPRGSRIRMYPPYIICIEPTFDMRFAIDIDKEFSMIAEENRITIRV